MKHLLLTLLLMWPAAGYAGEKMCASAQTFSRDRMPCLVTKISWVAVTHQGSHADIFKKEKANLERFIRLRLRNDLSALDHETLSVYIKALEKGNILSDAYNDFMNLRAQVLCKLWWVGDNNYPVARHTECWLRGYGSYSILHKIIKSSSLGYANSAYLIEGTKDAIRGNIESIASQFYAQRDLEAQKQPTLPELYTDHSKIRKF